MLGYRLKALRSEQGLTQEQLAKAFNMSRSTYAQYEVDRRNPDYETLSLFAGFFNVTTDYLLGRSDIREPSGKLVETKYNRRDSGNKRKIHAIPEGVKEGIRKFLTSENAGYTDYSIPDALNIVSIITGCGPIYPKIELADILDNKDIEITEGGEPLTPDKRKRFVQAIKDPDSVGIVNQVPVLGSIRAGIPLLSEQNIIGSVDIPAEIKGKADFALQVNGDSMIGAGIAEGDYVICKEDRTPYHGQIVVALVSGDETTLKYFIKENGHDILRAANPEYKDIQLKPGDKIQGRVVKVYKEPPPINAYRDFIYLRDEHLLEWNEVIEQAINNGIKPSVFREFIDMQVELAKRLAKK